MYNRSPKTEGVEEGEEGTAVLPDLIIFRQISKLGYISHDSSNKSQDFNAVELFL